MNKRTTIVLLALVLAGVGYLLWTQTDWFAGKPQPAAPETLGGERRLTPELGSIQKLTIETPGAGRITLTRRAGDWRLTEPIEADAGESAVNGLTMTLSMLDYARRYKPGDKDYPRDDLTHLSAPLMTISCADDKGKQYVLKVGQRVPLSPRQTYVQLAGGDNVYVVESDLRDRFAKSASDLRETKVVRFAPQKAVRVEVKGDESYRLVKSNGHWSIDQPVSARADQAAAEAMVRALSSIFAGRFVDDHPADLAAYGLGEPRLTITVELSPEVQTNEPRVPASGPPTAPSRSRLATTLPSASAPAGKIISITFGTAAEGRAFAKLADEPAVFTVDQAWLKDFAPRLIDLRDKRVLDLGGRKVDRVDVDMATSEPVTLEQSQGVWRMTRPLPGPADEGSVDELLTALREMKASEFQDNPAAPAAYGLEPPVGKIVLHFGDGEQTMTLLIGKATESGQMGFVQPAGGKSVAVIAAANYGKLLRPAAGYWDKTLLTLPADANVTQLEISRPGAPATTLKRDGAGQFKLLAPIAAPADAENVAVALAALRNIRAEKIVSLGDKLPDRFAALKPMAVTLSYTTPPPATASAPATRPAGGRMADRYLMIVKDQNKSYVWIPTIPADVLAFPAKPPMPLVVGELDENFYDTFAAEMRDRTVLKLDPVSAVSVKMTLDEVTLELARWGDVWRYATDRRVKIDAEKVQKFLSDLSEIKARRFVDYSARFDPKRFGLNKPAMVLEVADGTGKVDRLTVARIGPVGSEGFYAFSSQAPGVFVLAADEPTKMQQSLKNVRSDERERPVPTAPPELEGQMP